MKHSRIGRNIRLGIKNLLIHKLRSGLTVLGIVFGVGSVIAMLSVGEGASREALEQIRKLGSNNIIIDTIKPIEDESNTTQHSHMSIYGLLYEDEQRIRQTFPAVQRSVASKHVRKDGRLGERSLELRLVGTQPEWFKLLDRRVLAGRVLGKGDFTDRAAVCVLTEHGARRLLATENTIGKYVRIGMDFFRVIGIIQTESVSGDIQTPDQEVDAYVPLNVARERFGDVATRVTSGGREREMVELHQILVQVRGTDEVEATAKDIERMLTRFHKKKDYRIHVPLALLKQAEATKRTFNIVLGSIAGISLLVGGIGIMNIMLATVTERTREIGIRRAIGAKRRQIVGQFLIETVVLSTVGGLFGVAAGIGIPWIVTLLAGMPTVVTAWSVILALGISVAVGLIFGLYPAFRAAKLDPIEALRHE